MNSSPQPPEDSSPANQEPSQKGFGVSNIPEKYWALGAMVLWGGAILLFGLIRLDTYGMDEGGAMALLLAWSVAEKVVIPVTVLGGPDFRALFFWPVALYWPGSILAAKIFTMMVMFGGAYALYRWGRETHGEEVALIATGLLLIAPLTILQLDAVASAPFLLGAFGLGLWLDKKYRASQHSISSLYFLQMLLVFATVTLHPMGLAYPLALAWQWQKNPKSLPQKKQLWLGLGLATVIVLIMQLGWINTPWLSNPLTSLNQAIFSINELDPNSSGWLGGVLLIIALIVIIIKDYKSLSENLMGSMLLTAVVIGLLAADRNWAVISLALVLYKGFPLLIEANKKIHFSGFMGQRGLVMVVIMAFSILFMQADKSHAQFIQSEILSPVDELIRTLSKEAQDPEQPFIAASQWPARTMLVCRRDVLHLPPAKSDGAQLLNSMTGVTHIVYDHRSPSNDRLNKNLSEITGSTQTLAIQQAGVIIKIRALEHETGTQKRAPAENAPMPEFHKQPDSNIENNTSSTNPNVVNQ
ncbi:ArnT family glycosyltransferase [Kaarinaea lacus]